MDGTIRGKHRITYSFYMLVYHCVWQVIGKRPPCMSDKQNMPFVDATIAEVQRLSNICKSYQECSPLRMAILYGS